MFAVVIFGKGQVFGGGQMRYVGEEGVAARA